MKIRADFVTNSSSSSFIVALNSVPQSAEEVRKILGLTGEEFSFYDTVVSSQWVAETIFKDLQQQTPNNLDAIKSGMSGYFEDGPQYSDYLQGTKYDSVSARKAMDQYQADTDAFIEKKAQEFLQANQGKQIYVLEYSDNDSEGYAAIEHGGTFDAVPHLRVSHH